jgi:hypothetical protein
MYHLLRFSLFFLLSEINDKATHFNIGPSYTDQQMPHQDINEITELPSVLLRAAKCCVPLHFINLRGFHILDTYFLRI